MKFIHTADWHLGKRRHDLSLRGQQEEARQPSSSRWTTCGPTPSSSPGVPCLWVPSRLLSQKWPL